MRNLLRTFLVCAGAWFTLPTVAKDMSNAVEQEEVRQCRRNLHLVYEAIQAYRRAHKELPDNLAELYPQFLSENRFLICPASQRLGLTSADMTKWGGSGPATYGYEFSPKPVPAIMQGGSSRSLREWKRIQMGLVGSDVPIVRCQTHEHATLNLSFGGRIFETATLDWEEAFTNVVDRFALARSRCLATYTVLKRVVVPRRDPRARRNMIDLSHHFNLELEEVWPAQEPLTPLAALPIGITVFSGTSFDVRGAIQLGALRPGLVPYPSAVTNIAIGLPGRTVQLLLGTVHPAAPDTAVADCVFHLADGRKCRLQLRYGNHVAACVATPRERAAPLSAGKVAWTSVLSERHSVRLFHYEWTNPVPSQVIECMDFVAREGNTGPLLVALSIDQGL